TALAPVLAPVLAAVLAVALPAVRDVVAAAEVAEQSVPADQEIGKRFALTPDQLPRPFATRSVDNAPAVVPFTVRTPRVAEGFTVALVAKLQHPRRLLVLPNGDIIVAQQRLGVISLIRDEAPGKAAQVARLAQGFKLPYGLAWRDGEILVADQ